jgi:hypothetical protein
MRPMRPRAPLIPSVLTAVLASLALAPAAPAKGAAPPVVTKVSPSRLNIGQTLVLRGKNFRPGKLTNTVVFSRKGVISVFTRADDATKTRMTVVVPDKLAPYLVQSAGRPVATRFQIRVLAKRLSRSPTSRSRSPIIGPKSSGTDTPAPADDCDRDGVPNASDGDDDNDLLPDDLERTLKTDPCKADTDGDGVEDGYEYYSALDLNSRALPFPGKRPYANPLDPTDANTDYDGDTLTLTEEYSAWVRYGGHELPLNYSDGKPRSTGGERDDLRDVDNDGLTNYAEAHGPLSGQQWWTTFFSDEKAYKVTLPGTDWLDPDSDGDGRLDGADDQDFDGYDNAFESSRSPYWTQPFNPCLPDPSVDQCSPYVPDPNNAWPPFDSGYTKADQGPLVTPPPSG